MTIFSLPEYGLVTSARDGEEPKELSSRVTLRAKDFTALEQWMRMQSCETKESDLPVDAPKGYEQDAISSPFVYDRKIRGALRVQSHAGLVLLPSGDCLEIIPKITTHLEQDGKTRGRKILLRMLAAVWQLPDVTFPDATLATSNMPLLEVFISCFLKEVGQLIRRGVCSGYTTIEENLPCVRGRILLQQHIRVNSVHRERFYVSYDAYLPNRPENRLVKTALLRAYAISKNHDNKRRCKLYLDAFEEVPVSFNVQDDVFSTTSCDRNIRHYRFPLFWSRLLLTGQTPVPVPGNLRCTAILFPMEKLFEAYVTRQIRKELSQYGWIVTSQARSKYLIERYEGSPFSVLKPDILLQREMKYVIVDIKWKKIKSPTTISTADLYQLFAYSEKYLPRMEGMVRESFLLYPKTDLFLNSLEALHFYKDTSLLRAVAYDLETDACPLLALLKATHQK